MTPTAALDDQTEVEVRCPVPWVGGSGRCRPGRLLFKLRLSGAVPSFVHPDNLIELQCEDCVYRLRRKGHQVKRVLHRYDLAGNLIETLTDDAGLELSSPRGRWGT